MTNPQPSQNVAGQPAKAAGEYKPLTTFTIAAANVTQRPLRSLLLGLIAAVFTFLLFSSAMVTANLEAGISSLAARMGADVLVVPQGQGKKIQSVILRAEPSTFYLDGKLLDVVQKLPGVAKASGQLFISSLDAQCCSVKVQLIGIDEATDFVIAPWLKHAADKPLSGNDVIVGDYIYGEIGSTLKFFDQEYRIVGRLAPTGMGFDSSIFMTLDAARRAGRAASPDRADEMAQSLSAILVRVNPGVDPITVSDELLDQLGLKANVNFVFASNMMSDTSAKLQKVVSVMYTAAGGFWAAAAHHHADCLFLCLQRASAGVCDIAGPGCLPRQSGRHCARGSLHYFNAGIRRRHWFGSIGGIEFFDGHRSCDRTALSCSGDRQLAAGAGSERSGGHSYGAVGVATDCLADWPQRHLHDLARGLTS